MLYNSAFICDRDHPILIRDFDAAVQKAKSLTIENVKTHVAQEDAKYENHMRNLEEKKNKRNKTFEI